MKTYLLTFRTNNPKSTEKILRYTRAQSIAQVNQAWKTKDSLWGYHLISVHYTRKEMPDYVKFLETI